MHRHPPTGNARGNKCGRSPFPPAPALALALALVPGCAGTPPGAPAAGENAVAADPSAPPDGIYAIVDRAPERPEGTPADGARAIVLRYDGRYTASRGDPPEYLTLATASYVPLILDGPPQTSEGGDGWTTLGVTLAREHVGTLERFSREHLGGSVAIVIDGEVITQHKVRSVVTEGKLLITRCTDDACEVLRAKLVD